MTYTSDQLATRDDQRHAIVERILHGQWKGSTSIRELGAEWKMHARHVRELADEAWGVIRAMRKPGWEDEAEEAMAQLQAILAAAWAKKGYTMEGEAYDAPDLKVALNVVRTQLQVYGKLERPGMGANRAGGKPDHDEFDKLPAHEQAAMLRQAADELDGKRGVLQ